MPGVAQIIEGAWEEKQDVTKEIPKFSFEYYPPKTEKAVGSLYNKVHRMVKQGPLFIDLTWGAGGSTSDLTMQMSTNFKKMFGVEVNMHLTCTNITAESVKEALLTAKKNGITSICALRGDPPVGQDKWEAVTDGFNCGLDLVKFIKKEHGEHFSIAVSGYPEGHPNAIKEVADFSKLSAAEKTRVVTQADGKQFVCHDKDFASEIDYLKQKVDAGGSIILTQLFYDVDVFLAFVETCRKAGITVPIVPGIMPLLSHGGFTRMTGFCKTRIPDDMAKKVAELKDDAPGFKAYGRTLVTDICKRIWATGKVKALHFYALNSEEAVFGILENLGIKLNALDTEEDKKEIEKIAAMVKETMDQQKTAEESSPKKAKTSA
jgi:methylenetetrahydrofolate reductase (NADPH)